MIKNLINMTPPLITAMHVDGGGFLDSSEPLPMVRITFTAKFLEQPTGRFTETTYLSGSLDPLPVGNEQVKNLRHGQTSCLFEDVNAAVGASPTAYDFDLTDWHDYVMQCNIGSNSVTISVDGGQVRSTTVLNGMRAASGAIYKWNIFDNAKLYIKNMVVHNQQTNQSQATKFSWDFEAGDSVPSGWSNASIQYVIG